MKDPKQVIVNGKTFKIMKFSFLDGQMVRLKLAKILLPSLGALMGEGLKAVNPTNPIKDVKQMSIPELLGNIDSSVIEKACKSLVNAMHDDHEIFNLVHDKILNLVWFENKPLMPNIEQLFLQEKITYTDTDKLVYEVISHQGFFGNIIAKAQEQNLGITA